MIVFCILFHFLILQHLIAESFLSDFHDILMTLLSTTEMSEHPICKHVFFKLSIGIKWSPFYLRVSFLLAQRNELVIKVFTQKSSHKDERLKDAWKQKKKKPGTISPCTLFAIWIHIIFVISYFYPVVKLLRLFQGLF